MLNDDAEWFQKKNQRLLIELVAILNSFSQSASPASHSPAAISYIKQCSPETVEKVFLSPEGRQWINFSYRAIRDKKGEDAILKRYADWLGISRDLVVGHLICKLDLFLFSLFCLNKDTGGISLSFSLSDSGVFSGLNIWWRCNSALKFNLEVDGTLNVNNQTLLFKDFEYLRLMDAKIPGVGFGKLPESEKFAFLIDVYSEVARISFQGREQMPRIPPDEHAAIRQQIKVIDGALDYLQVSNPEVPQYFKYLTNYFVPLRPPEGTLPSSSNSSVDTMFWYSVTSQPMLMAEMIMHEFSHQRLFRLQDVDPLIDPTFHGSGWEVCEIYSPWRDDPRPINGVFHGFVVFTEAAGFWHSLITADILNPNDKNISERRFAMLALQLDLALKSLSEVNLTALGSKVFDHYKSRIENEFLPFVRLNKIDTLKPFFMEFHDDVDVAGSSIIEVVENHRIAWKKGHYQTTK
jgi:hypothetical protein